MGRYSFKSSERAHDAFTGSRDELNALRQKAAEMSRAITALREQNESLKRQLQNGPERSGDALLGEALRQRYGGRFSSLQDFLRTIDAALGPAAQFGGALPSRVHQ